MRTTRLFQFCGLMVLCGALGGFSRAAELQWHTDLAKAQAQARTSNKKVLINFTGSDWCGYCIRLQKEVFATPEFQEFAQKNLVLVEVDFPRRKTLPKAQKAANEKLKTEYQIRGFPTLVILDSEGKKLGEIEGYGGGGPRGVIEKIEAAKG